MYARACFLAHAKLAGAATERPNNKVKRGNAQKEEEKEHFPSKRRAYARLCGGSGGGDKPPAQQGEGSRSPTDGGGPALLLSSRLAGLAPAPSGKEQAAPRRSHARYPS